MENANGRIINKFKDLKCPEFKSRVGRAIVPKNRDSAPSGQKFIYCLEGMDSERTGLFGGLIILVREARKYSFSEEKLNLQLNCFRPPKKNLGAQRKSASTNVLHAAKRCKTWNSIKGNGNPRGIRSRWTNLKSKRWAPNRKCSKKEEKEKGIAHRCETNCPRITVRTTFK